MATQAQKVKYQGKEYEVASTYEFNNRKFYRLKGIASAISERLLDKKPEPETEVTD